MNAEIKLFSRKFHKILKTVDSVKIIQAYLSRNNSTHHRKLHKMMKTLDYMKIIQAILSRNDFTLHGLHLNISGKEKMTELIGESIKNTNGKERRNPHNSEMGRNKRILPRKKLRKN